MGKKKPLNKEGLTVSQLTRDANLNLSKHVSGDRKLKTRLRRAEKNARDAVTRTAHFSAVVHTEQAGFLEAETPLERTYKVQQPDLLELADTATNRRADFQLNLKKTRLGPYAATYSPSGKSILVYGRKGHVSVTNWRNLVLNSEIHLNETVRDGTFLHNDGFYALAQRKYVSIYDSSSVELHTMRNHRNPIRLAFLPYHFLLTSLSEGGDLTYTDTSTGEVVAELKTYRMGRGASLTLNPWNGTLCTGHASGTVAIWSPASSEPLAKILTHRGSVNATVVSPDGNTLITAGGDSRLNFWDLRTYQRLNTVLLPTPGKSLAMSQRGLLAVSFGPHLRIFRNALGAEPVGAPYMTNLYPAEPIERLCFCPYEDVLGVSHTGGFSTMIVPGAGEPNFDSSLPNPFETSKQRREREVKSLMDKLAPETIALDPNVIGGIDPNPAARQNELREKQREANAAARKKTLEKKRMRGRNKISKKLKRKQNNVIDERKEALQEALEQRKKAQEAEKAAKMEETIAPALRRFIKKQD